MTRSGRLGPRSPTAKELAEETGLETEAVAKRIGVSQMRVSRVPRRAADHLHRATRAAA